MEGAHCVEYCDTVVCMYDLFSGFSTRNKSNLGPCNEYRKTPLSTNVVSRVVTALNLPYGAAKAMNDHASVAADADREVGLTARVEAGLSADIASGITTAIPNAMKQVASAVLEGSRFRFRKRAPLMNGAP